VERTASRGVAGVPVTGCLARGEALVGFRSEGRISRAPLTSSHLRVVSTRNENPRESAPLVTGGPTTGLTLARVGSERRGCREAATERPTRKRAVTSRTARSAMATPRREEWDWYNGSIPASSRSSGSGPFGGLGHQGQEGAGCRRKGARARRSARQKPSERAGAGLVTGAL